MGRYTILTKGRGRVPYFSLYMDNPTRHVCPAALVSPFFLFPCTLVKHKGLNIFHLYTYIPCFLWIIG
ncbi:hypothetical protein RJT34_19240 [Clitoria ternatea]|uniref:Uncharacterized protein n=1 Tax=Clitoria ternatea TaxID=43366 RepID=A0AAN9P4F2_CLITE